VFFTGAAFTIHGDTYVASQPSSYGCVVSEAVLSCLTHVSAAAIANNLAAAYRAAGRTAEGRTRTPSHLIRRSVPYVRPVRLNPYPQVSILRVPGMDAIVPYHPASP
jgi:hypothetical protein